MECLKPGGVFMVALARRNLFHDRVRLLATLTGIVFSVVLTTIQLGLFVGFIAATADIIVHAEADLWIKSQNVGYFEAAVPFPENKRYRVLGTPGVADVKKYIAQFGDWKLPNGAVENVLLIGFDPDGGMGAPWNLTQGHVADLKLDDTVMIDELYRAKLGTTHLGQRVEIRGQRARVVGFTRGIRTFTTSPAVFTSFKNAQNYAALRPDQTLYLLVQAAPGVDLQTLKRRLQARVVDVDVLTTAEWCRMQVLYWIFGTGAGFTVLIAASLGLLVGVVVVAQTIYAATIDHLREYGTLKAMGASNRYLYRVILKQAAMSGCMGYVVGMAISLTAAIISQQSATAIMISWGMVLAMLGMTLGMCMGASMLSINKVTRLDPAMVFKG
jgi:putative ABC transport system permease protein